MHLELIVFVFVNSACHRRKQKLLVLIPAVVQVHAVLPIATASVHGVPILKGSPSAMARGW